jgi:preprotein translocase subunit SecD
MPQSTRNTLVFIIVLTILSAFIVWPGNPGLNKPLDLPITRDIRVVLGLDLQGGLQLVLQAKPTSDTPLDPEAMATVKSIIENRVNALGVTEPLVQIQGSSRILVELPGIKNPEDAIRSIGQTGELEFIDAGDVPPIEGSLVTTTLGGPEDASATPSSISGLTTTPTITATADISPTTPVAATRVYTTVLTGRLLKSASVGYDEYGKPQINFELRKIGDKPEDDGPRIFGEWTTANINKYLAITLDKKVISAPIIQSPITQGTGRITGRFTLAEAQGTVVVLKYGALPIPLEIIENRSVGPTLGQDSIDKSVVAGAIGLLLVVFFMAVYYRLPGLLADMALVIYSLIVFALFKLIPVTLTLAGIAGFILSIGMAVDANILIFERMKEEMRAGKTLGAAIEAGFARAWNSIRDSNIATLIICGILYVFGSYFGTSMIRGFALTLAIGVLCSMFTAITVTRTFLRVTQTTMFPRPTPEDEPRLRRLFGVTD